MQELKNAGNKSNRELTFTDSYRAFCNDSYCLLRSPGPRAINNTLIYCRLFRSWSNGAGRFNKCEIGSESAGLRNYLRERARKKVSAGSIKCTHSYASPSFDFLSRSRAQLVRYSSCHVVNQLCGRPSKEIIINIPDVSKQPRDKRTCRVPVGSKPDLAGRLIESNTLGTWA